MKDLIKRIEKSTLSFTKTDDGQIDMNLHIAPQRKEMCSIVNEGKHPDDIIDALSYIMKVVCSNTPKEAM